jgi:NAD(P)-dependent dehydrogenase (short-subunit alcohol dehydrogenase family)
MSTPQVVLVTGGARGIGFGIASCFAKQNATLVIADVQETSAQEACERLKEIGAADALGLACDIADRAQVETAVQTAIEKFSRIDVLVNNAGISPFIPVMDLSPDTFHKVLDVNLTGGFYCTQVVAKHMIERAENSDKGGRIIFISSLAPHFSQPSQVEYSAGKAGVEGLMRGFATALGPHGITSNAIAPGMILTPLTESHWSQPEPAERIQKLVPVGRIGTPEDIGNVAVFLASSQAAYVNGTVITVDGGFSVLIKG